MTDVVTNAAAYVQPLLYANRQQSLGIPNPESPETDIALATAASQQQQTLDSTQVAQASDDRSSLQQGDDETGQSQNRSFADQLPTSGAAPETSDAASLTTGPAKARVDMPVFDMAALTSTSVADATPQAALPSAQAAETQTTPDATPQPQVTGVLGAAAPVADADLPIMSANIFGVAFAPVQLGQVSGSTSTQPQKNFIFAQGKMYGGTAVASASAGRFASSPAAAPAAGSQFAASASGQKLSGIVTAAANSIAATDGGPTESSADTRASFYQRAQAVAQAFNDKSSNPAVKNLVATLESYARVAGIGVSPAAHPTVRVVA